MSGSERTKRSLSKELVSLLTSAFVKLVWQAMDDLMLKILIVSALISIVISMIFEHDKTIVWVEGAAILMAVAVVTMVTAYNDFKKES